MYGMGHKLGWKPTGRRVVGGSGPWFGQANITSQQQAVYPLWHYPVVAGSANPPHYDLYMVSLIAV